jgi:hypothetical protein
MITMMLAIGSVAGAVAATDSGGIAAETSGISLTALREFRLEYGSADEPPAEDPAPGEPDSEGEARPGFGSAGSDWLTFGGAAAYNFDEDYDFNLHFAWSTFLADRLEFGVEASAWYFDQVGENTAGISGMFVFRYHWWSGPRGDFDWSSFLDLGTGMLAGFDTVPDGGTGFNFIQRAGLGITKDLDAADGPAHGARLVCGIRWHHISNGRFGGDGRNPSRDSILGFVGVQWDF